MPPEVKSALDAFRSGKITKQQLGSVASAQARSHNTQDRMFPASARKAR